MKKVSGIILLIIAGLNLVAIVVRGANGEPVGSPGYIVILIVMIVGGAYLVNNASEESKEDAEA